MAVNRGKRYIVRRSKDDRNIVFGRRAKRLGKHPLGEFTASASPLSVTGVSIIDETLTLASGGNVYAIDNIPFDRFYTREWDANRTLSGEDSLIAGHVSRNAVVTGLNVIFGISISASAPTELADYKPSLADNTITYMSGQKINLTPSVATGSKEATMIIWDRPSGETWPTWLTQDSDLTGKVSGTAPSWDGTSGDGTTDDYEFCLKAGNPFGQAPTAKWIIKVRENTFSTPWTKAIDQDTHRDRLMESAMISDGTAASADALMNPCARLSNGDGRGWTAAMLFYHRSDVGTLWAYGNHQTDANLTGCWGYVLNDGTIGIKYGQPDNNYIQLETDYTISDNTWHAMCWTFDGNTTGADLDDVEDYYGRFKFYTLALDSTHEVTERAWGTKTNSHQGYTGPISGDAYHFTIGSRYANVQTIEGQYAFFGLLNTCLTATSDIQHFITDPMDFKADKEITDGALNKIWLMGDGTGDTYANIGGGDQGYILNQVDTSADDQTFHGGLRDYTLEGQSGDTDDLVSVTIPSLGN